MSLSEREKRIVHVIGQTMFPRGGVLDIDASDVGVVAWVDDYVDRMPWAAGAQIRALLQAINVGFGPWYGQPSVPLTQAAPSDREAYFEHWATHANATQRTLFEALRAMFTIAYVESPAVLNEIQSEAT